MSILARSFNDRLIRIRQSDRYVSATDMAQACGKRYHDWARLSSTVEYLQELESVAGIPVTELVQVFQGGTPENQGTWLHPKVALRFAQWCSAKFAVQVDCWIDELLTTGKVELESENLKSLQMTEVILDKQIKLGEQQLRLAELQNTMLTLHGAPTVLALAGKEDQVVEVEKPVIEVIDKRHNVRFKGQTTSQLAKYANQKYGTKFKNGPDIVKFLQSVGKESVISQTLRTVTNDYIPEEYLPEVMQLIASNKTRQLLLGE
jgi:hypothetical protein